MVTKTNTDKVRELTGTTVMTPSIQVFLQFVLFCCMVTSSEGGITDFEKRLSQLENKVIDSQEEIKSLYQIIGQLERRLKTLEAKGESGDFQIYVACSHYSS